MTALTVEDVKGLKVAELKQELSARGLAVSGLKKEVNATGMTWLTVQLADRLHAAIESDVSSVEKDASSKDSAPQGESVQPTTVEPSSIPPTNDGLPPTSANVETGPGESSSASLAAETGVGSVMVEGEAIQAADPEEKEDVKEAVLETMPAALDTEVAKVVAEEETKEILERVPTPPRPLTPLPADVESQARSSAGYTPSRPRAPDATGKRSRSPSPGLNAPKRPRKRNSHPLPPRLRRLVHPPTTVLYISNLRRPMQLSTLHEYLFEDDDSLAATDLLPPPKNPFANSDCPGLWLSGVKDHAYASFRSVDAALAVAERIEGVKWPEDTGDKLGVQFVDEDEVDRLVEREQFAWGNGRQKMVLKIEKDGEDGFKFDLSVALGSAQQGGLSRGSFDRPPGLDPRRMDARAQGRLQPVAPPLTGGLARGGPSGGPMSRGGQLAPGRGGPPGRPAKYTRHRPSIMWREGPGAVR